jgi:predicted nucleotidyltransferase
MNAAGIIVEYNPLHMGHVHLLRQTRRILGEDTVILCCMSGDFVQRGDFALLRRQARAKAAVQSGADLVVELPLPWAVSSAEGFARGAVETLLSTNVLTHLAFGSECGDGAALLRTAAALQSEEFPALLRQELKVGDSFAAARERAVGKRLSPEDAALLQSPNNILGIEYCKALLDCKSTVEPLTIRRFGAAHDAKEAQGTIASASAIRTLLKEGEKERALSLMAPAMKEAYLEEEAAGRAPVLWQNSERAILARLRSMRREEFAALDQGKEGLYNRLYEASRTAAGVEELLAAAKTKRYAYARLRRMVLWAYLGLKPAELPQHPVYLRPLAMNDRGRAVLAKMRKEAALPILTKPADVRRLGPEAQRLFAMEAAAADLYSLSYPDLAAARGDTLWKEGPVLL